jgi:hypothetical protein
MEELVQVLEVLVQVVLQQVLAEMVAVAEMVRKCQLEVIVAIQETLVRNLAEAEEAVAEAVCKITKHPLQLAAVREG